MGFIIYWLTPDRFDLKPNKSPWLEMTKALDNYGHKTTIVTGSSKSFAKEKKEYNANISFVKALDLPFIFRFSVLLNMFFWLKKHASPNDVIIMNQDSLLIAPLLRMAGFNKIHLDIRTIPVELHSIKDYLDRLFYWHIPIKMFSSLANSYSFITERLKQEVENEFNLQIDDYTIWQSGVSTATFFPKTLEITPPKQKNRLFYHGSISINRGIDLIIKALALLEKETEIEFVIVGGGAGLNELKSLASTLSVNNRVIFKGLLPYEEMVNEIAKADICICPLPDRLEWNVSSPIKVFEYMACAKPIILTPISAHTDVAGNAPFIVWTKGSDPEDFKKAILESIEKLPLLTGAAKQGPDIVKNNYEWKNQAKKLESQLLKNLGKPE